MDQRLQLLRPLPRPSQLCGIPEQPQELDGGGQIRYYALRPLGGKRVHWAIIPLDELAIEAQATCASRETFPAVVSGEQAQLRVWIAIYDCYPRLIEGVGHHHPPPIRRFHRLPGDPIRWVVEGLAETTLEVTVDRPAQGGGTETSTEERTQANSYGLWDVDTNTGAIFPLDQEARDIVDLAAASGPCSPGHDPRGQVVCCPSG